MNSFPVPPRPVTSSLIKTKATILSCFNYPTYHQPHIFESIEKELYTYYQNGGSSYPFIQKETIRDYFERLDPSRELHHFFLFLQSTISITVIDFNEFRKPLTNFMKYMILHLLWEFGEDWDEISFRLFANPKFGSHLKSEIYGTSIYNPDLYEIRNYTSSLSQKQFYSLLKKFDSCNINQILDQMTDIIAEYPYFSALFAKYLKTRNDFSVNTFVSMIQKLDYGTSLIFSQLCILNGIFSKTDIVVYPAFTNDSFVFNVIDENPANKFRRASLQIKNESPPPSIPFTQESFNRNLYYNVVDQVRNISPNILFVLMFKDHLNITPYERSQFMAFCMNTFIISPKAYHFIRNFLKQLCGHTEMYENLTPIIEKYVSLLTYDQRVPLFKKLKTIVALRINSIPDDIQTIYATLGGDGAQVLQRDENAVVPKNLYCFEFMPLDWHLPVFPIQFCLYDVGSINDEIKSLYTQLTNYLNQMNKIKIIFKAADGETKLNFWFNEPFQKGGCLQPEVLKLPFKEVVTIALQSTDKEPFPISDMIHLFKCARAHCQGHCICVDIEHLICINMELLKEATGLFKNLEDKSTQGRMNDKYAFQLFSYDAFISLLAKGRFEAAFYVLPFVALNEAARNVELQRQERMKLLEIAYKVFLHHYSNIVSSPPNEVFPQRYSKNALGTSFGDINFIRRCICTTIGFAISLNLNIPRVCLGRIGTHCIECHFGTMRYLQNDNNSSDLGIKAAAKACIILDNNRLLNIPTKINTRANNAGVKLDIQNEKIYKERIFLNPDLVPDLIYNLMINSCIDVTKVENLVLQLNTYSKEIYHAHPTTDYADVFYFNSSKPFSRYLAVSAYRISTAPIPQEISKSRINSPLDFFFKKAEIKKQVKLKHWEEFLKHLLKDIISIQRTDDLSEKGKQNNKTILKLLRKIVSPKHLLPLVFEDDEKDMNGYNLPNPEMITTSGDKSNGKTLAGSIEPMINTPTSASVPTTPKRNKPDSSQSQPNSPTNGWGRAKLCIQKQKSEVCESLKMKTHLTQGQHMVLSASAGTGEVRSPNRFDSILKLDSLLKNIQVAFDQKCDSEYYYILNSQKRFLSNFSFGYVSHNSGLQTKENFLEYLDDQMPFDLMVQDQEMDLDLSEEI